MNNYRLSTYKPQEGKVEITQSLIDTVLNMEDIYIIGEDGLLLPRVTSNFRGEGIKAIDGTLVSRQLFYILASGSNGEKLIF